MRPWLFIASILLGLPLAATPFAGEPGVQAPKGLVPLRDIDPSILQDMRYATARNFTGKVVLGYQGAQCRLQLAAAEALKRVQSEAKTKGFSLLVYDCYRPVEAVSAFLAWAAAPGDATKAYYPHLDKSQLVPDYIASRSQHSTGTAVDLTLIPTGETPAPHNGGGDCTAPVAERDGDNSVDMGTAFDCFDPKANTASPLATPEQRKARLLLKSIMERAGFVNYPREWWHFSFKS